MHIHVYCADGEAKFWIFPEIRLARNYRLSKQQINEVMKIIEERRDEIRNNWNKHFGY